MNERLRWVRRGATVMALLLVGRAFSIQILRDDRLEQMARKQFRGKVLLSPRRGAILDRNGEALAVNIETQSLAANPAKLRKRKDILRLLGKSLNLQIDKILSKTRDKKGFAWIKRHLSEQELNLLKKFQIIAADGDLVEGLWLVRESKRVYPHHDLAAHVLGSTNVDSEGTEGVELWRDSQLKGSVVAVNTTRDALGRATFLDATAAGTVRDGTPVRLTLDSSLQYAVEQELKFSIARTGSRAGSVIVMNATNGEILAVANEPTFDPNFRLAPVESRRNRALTDGYEPGSTLKPVLLASALSGGMKLSDQIWGGQGSFKVQGKTISEAESHEKFEWITLKKMIQVSSNVVSAKLALKLGAETYSKTLQQMGFGQRTGTGFPGEIAGKMPAGKSWQPLTLANVGFGQGVLVTPLQMARAYATFLNGGWLVQPTLIQSETGQGEPPRRVLSQAVAEQVQQALSSVTSEGGTGEKARLEGYSVAGKTGTSQTVEPGTRKYSKTRYISSFIGFARGVEPRLVIYAALDGPRGVYYASETAAPLFQRVLQSVVTRFSIPADSPLAPSAPEGARSAPILAQVRKRDPLTWEGAAPAAGGESALPSLFRMPSLVGFTAREALRALQGHPVEVEIRGEGLVKSQFPAAGNAIAGRTQVQLQLAVE
jgi:cell division protein FtsI (penicillin-binding protein 3)